MNPTLSKFDTLIVNFDKILRGFTGQIKGTNRANPAADCSPVDLSEKETHHVAGLMRVNYTGEIAAQALYLGQALVARNEKTRKNLLQSAHEEEDHLVWCKARLDELSAQPSYLNPLWFIGSLTIGITAGLISDAYSLGFVVETERQVEAHLTEHLQKLPTHDHRSRVILEQMRTDEQHHGTQAMQQGAKELPELIKLIMHFPAKIMTTTAYYW